jgi:hypothetical protein
VITQASPPVEITMRQYDSALKLLDLRDKAHSK